MILTRPSPFKFADADLYLVWGQSNAQGKAPLSALPSSLSGSRPNAYIWNGSTFVNLQAQVNSGYTQAGQDWGLEMLLSELAQANQGRAVYIVKHAVGGTPLLATTGSTWNPDVSGNLYEAAFANLRSAMNLLKGRGRKPIIRGFVWGQGEGDSQASGNTSAYQTKQATLFNAVRTLAGNSSLPIVDMLVRDEYSAYAYAEDINTAKANVASALGNVKLVKTRSFDDNGDDIHYGGPAQLAFGRHAFEYIHSKTYPLPSGLPTLAFQYDASRQENFTLSTLLHASQWNDTSPNALHMTQATEANQPGIVEGPLGLGMGTMRFSPSRGFTGGANPFATDSFFTLAFLISNFSNPTGNSVRTPIRSLGTGSWILFWPALGSGNAGNDKLRLRNGSSTVVLQSSASAGAGAEIYVVTYGGSSGSVMRRNGVQVASSTTAVSHTGGGNLAIGDLTTTALTADIPVVLGFSGAASASQIEKIEGYIAQRFVNSLPSSHPYYSTMPT